MNICDTSQVKQAPSKAFYIPDFITENEEESVLLKLYEAPKPKWVHLSNRRLQNWGGLPHSKGMVAEPIPPWLKTCMKKVDTLNCFEGNLTNHVLVNEYLPGQGIMPHVDGPLFYPTITTINLGSHSVLDLYLPFEEKEHKEADLEQNDPSRDLNSRRIGSFLLEPRSLLVLQNDLYTKYLHGISERCIDALDNTILNLDMTSHPLGETIERKTRVSLTIRYFPKVLKCKIFNFK